MNDTRSPNEFIALDWVGCVWVVAWFLPLYFLSVITAPHKEFLLDLGAHLPLLTLLALTPWFGPLLGVICTGIFALQWLDWFQKRLFRRRMIIVVSFISAILFMMACAIGLCLPMYQMSRTVGGL